MRIFAIDNRALDRWALDQKTALVIVVIGFVCLLFGIVIRAMWAESKREREEAANAPPPDERGDGPAR